MGVGMDHNAVTSARATYRSCWRTQLDQRVADFKRLREASLAARSYPSAVLGPQGVSRVGRSFDSTPLVLLVRVPCACIRRRRLGAGFARNTYVSLFWTVAHFCGATYEKQNRQIIFRRKKMTASNRYPCVFWWTKNMQFRTILTF